MHDITVRRAVREDIPVIQEFTRSTFSWGDYVYEALKDWIEGDGDLWVADADGRAVGVTHVRYLSRDIAWFEGIRVHPDYRKHGIGRLLTEASILGAKERGALTAYAAIDMDNLASQSLAKSMGFRLADILIELSKAQAMDMKVCLTTETRGPNLKTLVSPREDLCCYDKNNITLYFTDGVHAGIRKATSEDIDKIYAMGKDKVRFIGSNFTWRPFDKDTIALPIDGEMIFVGVKNIDSQKTPNLEAGPFLAVSFVGTPEIHIQKETSEKVEIEVFIGATFGEEEGVERIVRYLFDRAISLANGDEKPYIAHMHEGDTAEIEMCIFLEQNQRSLRDFLLRQGFTLEQVTQETGGSVGIWEIAL